MVKWIQVVGNAWCSWSQNQVIISKDFFEILDNEGTDLSSFLVVGIIVTWWKAESTKHDTAFYFFAETLATAVDIDFIKISCIFCTVAITNTIKALQVWWSFWRSDDVVYCNPVFRVWKANFFNDSTKFFKVLSSLEDRFLNLWVNPFTKIFFR